MIDYFDMPEKTAETIDGDGWLHSGDLGTMDEHGYVRITGRLKDMIVHGGENIFPAEIENRLYAHPSIANVAVVGVPDETWGEQVATVVQLADSATLDVAGLNTFCRETLASHKVPRLWYTTDEYPLTGSGKVQKFMLVDGSPGRAPTRSLASDSWGFTHAVGAQTRSRARSATPLLPMSGIDDVTRRGRPETPS